MPTAFAEREDVRHALQKSTRKFGSDQLSDDIVDAALQSVSAWFQAQTDAYFYDSGGAASDLVDTSPASATGIIESVGSSPHRQGRQVFATRRGAAQPRYPNTKDGVFCRVQLPALYVDTVDRLAVRDRGGGVTDWVADPDISEGRDEDYYVQVDGTDSYGRSYLYLRADTIGGRASFADLLTIDLTYGLDQQDRDWQDVRRGIAALAAAQVVVDDDVIAQLPDSGSLIGAATQQEQLREMGVASDVANLSPYMGAHVV